MLCHIVAEIIFKFETFGVLVVDIGAHHGRLIGATFVGERDVIDAAKLSGKEGIEASMALNGVWPFRQPWALSSSRRG